MPYQKSNKKEKKRKEMKYYKNKCNEIFCGAQ